MCSDGSNSFTGFRGLFSSRRLPVRGCLPPPASPEAGSVPAASIASATSFAFFWKVECSAAANSLASFTSLRCSVSFVFERKHEEMAMYWEYAVLRSLAAVSTLSAFFLVFFSLNSPMRSERKV